MIILAWQIAKEEWTKCGDGSPFETLLGNYFQRGGYVVNFPEVFVMAMPTMWRNGRCAACYPDNADTWFVHLAAGTPAYMAICGNPVMMFLKLAPFMLPYVAWHRRGQGRLRRYSTTRIARILASTHGNKHLNPAGS
jgi:hypothetical protein